MKMELSKHLYKKELLQGTAVPEVQAGKEDSGEAEAESIDYEDMLKKVIDTQSQGLKRWYAGPGPGLPIKEEEMRQMRDKSDQEIREIALEQIVLLVIKVDTVDYCDLSGSPHKRTIYTERESGSQTNWSSLDVYP
ncbi:hypothetical protein AX774_g494 [Zancudomyces culisetae]|uniref:Uncharacterized protein n=1 Tax=Zancudomyces culisetae TaxID=1213189 RepID=A0A1R1PYB4_ZANCU|nr:hypothetical protein AX774_g494 [Zancudomyces culisetae]|eukprot:OMH85952.1 hypothetical protein AX774_g494 [Zancudomyces culisetae]